MLVDGRVIEPRHLPRELRATQADQTIDGVAADTSAQLYQQLTSGESEFWEAVHRAAVRQLIERAYAETGSYKGVAALFRIDKEYKRFINYLYYHGLRVDD